MEKALPCHSVTCTAEGQAGGLNLKEKNPTHRVRKITTDLHPFKQKGFQPHPCHLRSCLLCGPLENRDLLCHLDQKEAGSRYRDGCTHYCRNHLKYLRWVALYAPKIAFSLHCQFCFSCHWVTRAGQGWCSERNCVRTVGSQCSRGTPIRLT